MKRPSNGRLILIALVNLAWGAGFIWLLLSGLYSMYISISLWPLMAAGAILSLAITILLFISPAMARRENETSADLISAGILLIPLLYFHLYQGDTLGSFALERRTVGMVEQIQPIEFASPASEILDTDLKHLTDDYGSFAGSRVTLEGAYYGSSEVPVLYRFLVFCCLNDAVPRAVFLESADEHFETDQWLRITGTADTLHLNGGIYPMIRNIEADTLPPPGSPYLFP